MRVLASCLLALALASVLAATPAAAYSGDPVGCTQTFAATQYFATGEYLFVHGQLKQYGGDTTDNAGAYSGCLGTLNPRCESAFVTAQRAATDEYLASGQLKDYAGDTSDNIDAYMVCSIQV